MVIQFSIVTNIYLFIAPVSVFQVSNTALATYLVDPYPLQFISVITYYPAVINLAGFTSPVCGPVFS